ncbi:MAG: response regulator [Planctomycetes bacterium]|nr:response regulator [Planctomycetota bacterium]
MKALVIDDSPTILKLMGKLLERVDEEVEVTTALDGALGIECMNADSFDVIFVDKVMPNMDGLQFLEAARKIDASVFIYMITSISDQDTIFNAVEAGASSYFTKPLDPEMFVNKVNMLFTKIKFGL